MPREGPSERAALPRSAGKWRTVRAMTLPTRRELDLLLDPLERTALILLARYGDDAEEWKAAMRGGDTTGDGDSSGNPGHVSAERIAALRAAAVSGRRKLEGLVAARERVPPVQEVRRRRRPPLGSGRLNGKSVTLRRTLPTTPEKEEIMPSTDRVNLTISADSGGDPVPSFAERAEAALSELEALRTEAEAQAQAVLADLTRMRFQAHQIDRVFRALKLTVPTPIAELSFQHEAEAAGSVPGVAEMVMSTVMPGTPLDLRGRREEATDAPVDPDVPPEPETAGEAASAPPAPAPSAAPPAGHVDPPPAKPAPPARRSPQATRSEAENPMRFLESGPDGLQTRVQVTAALRAMARDINSARLAKEWGITTGTGDRVLREMYSTGELVLQKVPERGETITYGVKGVVEDVLDSFPVGSVAREDLAAWKDGRKTIIERIVAAQQAALMKAFEETRNMTVREAAQMTGISSERVGDYVRALRAEGRLHRVERRRSHGQTTGRLSEALGPIDEHPVAEKVARPEPPASAPEPPSEPPDAALLARVRDYVCDQKAGRMFNPATVAGEVGVPEAVALACLRQLEERQVVVDQGLDGMPLFAYSPPNGPGKAAELDAARAREHAQAEKNGTISDPVAGTGGGLTVRDPDVRQLVADCERVAPKSVSPASSGHFAVQVPGGSRVLISKTPRSRQSVIGDRARLRKAGLKV